NAFANTEGSIDHYLALVTQESSMLIETSTASTTIRDALGGTITAEQAGGDFDPSAIDLSVLVPGAGPFPGIEVPAPGCAGVVGVHGVHAPAGERQDLAPAGRLPARGEGRRGRARGPGVLAARPGRRPAPAGRRAAQRRRPRPVGPADRPLPRRRGRRRGGD